MRSVALGVGAAIMMTMIACDEPSVPNYNAPEREAVNSDPGRLQLLANGILIQLAAQAPGYNDDLGTLGRESYEYTPTEGRNTTHFLGVQRLDRAGFASGLWNPRYTNLRNVSNFLLAVEAAPNSAAEKSAAKGFAKTIEALEILYLISTRDTIGVPIEIREELNFIAPFVTRDSAYRYISARLDEAAADLAAGGTAFPFRINIRFVGVASTPAGFRQVNRAIKARVEAYRGSLGCGATCYAAVQSALAESFLQVPTGSVNTLDDRGVYNLYSTVAGGIQNTMSRATTTGTLRYAHPSILIDTNSAGRYLDPANDQFVGTINAARAADRRVLNKVARLRNAAGSEVTGTGAPVAAGPVPASLGIRTPYANVLFPTASSPIPIIRNEELLLLRAEAYIMTNNFVLALADLNTVRSVYGGVGLRAPFLTQADGITALLEERRLSLLFEGHRIIDLRRFGRLSLLPRDLPTHFVNSVFPVPQAECLSRQLTPELRPPSCTT